MIKRPAIPRDVQQQLLSEVRHRCAADCEPVSLEKAHIIPWSRDHGPENLSRLRRIALNLLQQETTRKRGIKIKRLRAGWDHDYLLKVLTG